MGAAGRWRVAGWVSVAVALGLGAVLLPRYAPNAPYSNIRPEDYVGPDACRECHAEHHRENYESWRSHSHRTMNQDADEESVEGDFSGVELRYGRGRAVFHRDGGRFLMSIHWGAGQLRRYVVTRTVGSRYVQYYVGKQIEGPEPRSNAIYQVETKLPFGYSIALRRWLPEIYFDSTVPPERFYLENPKLDYIYSTPPLHLWNSSCLTCHNTYPYVARLWDQQGRRGEGSTRLRSTWRAGFPEEAVDWRGSKKHRGGLRLAPGLRVLDRRDLVTVGISCESCHFGGREHAVKEREIRFVPTSTQLAIHRPGSDRRLESDREDPLVVNSICAQCHNAGLATYPDGSHAVNSSESLAMEAGACRGAIKCTDCHSPHEAGPPSGSPDLPGHVEACLGCHAALADSGARARHARHGSAVDCLDCHMPRIVAGLDTVVRSHRISVPGDPRMLGVHAPNACNLCHLDRSIDWTLAELARGWGVEPRGAPADGAAGGELASPVGEWWLRAPDRFLRAVAVEAHARSPLAGDRLAAVLPALDDEQAYNRTLALIVVERLLGRPVSREEYDLLAPSAERARQSSALAQAHRSGP